MRSCSNVLVAVVVVATVVACDPFPDHVHADGGALVIDVRVDDASSDAPRIDAATTDAGPPDAPVTATVCSLALQDCPEGSACMLSGPQANDRACFPGDCDLVRQDCPDGQMCSYVYDASIGASVRTCHDEGTAREGESCVPYGCARGLWCAGTVATCYRYCHVDADCAPGVLCRGLAYNRNTAAITRLCVP